MERYEAYKDSGIEWIGEIPQHWNLYPLGACSSMIVPMRDKPTRFDGDIPWIRIEDFSGKTISASRSGQNVSEELIAEMNLKVYPVGTVLCSCSCNLGVCAIVDKPLCSNQTFIGCVPNKHELDSVFLFYLMGSMDRRLNYLSSGTIQTYLSRHDFEHLTVQVPPIEEQRVIADYLDAKTSEIDSLIADCEREVGLLQEYRKAVISEAVTKGLDPDAPMKDSGIEWIGEIPEGWRCCRIKQVAHISSGATPNRDNYSYWNGNIPWIKTGELLNCTIRESEESITEDALEETSVQLYPAGTILMAMYGQGKTRGMTGMLAIASTTNQACAAIQVFTADKPSFVWKALMAGYDAIRDVALGSGQPNLNAELVGNFCIPIPASIQEQEMITEYLDDKTTEIDALIDAKQSMADKLREYRKLLISEAVTGKFKVPEVVQ